ncbi:MAG: peptide chain release factor N(5)-glutamine methyltransferase [Deltaproteobacteria bacterium]|nr:peptide chain release factor N(5)-glutamine methyltransferase [Deltaproteobacteria bacterium]
MPPPSWTIKALIDVTTDYFREKGIDSPRLDAELLLSHLLQCRRLDLYLRFDQPLSRDELTGYRSLVRRRAGREPLQYICGRQEFWSLDFEVGPGVLIPRQETELLVEKALDLHREGALSGGGRPRVLDLGTGSGILAVCMAREIETARVWASDLSGEALDRARRNARSHGLDARIAWVQGDLFSPFRPAGGKRFDLILANPPYVPEEELEGLAPEVRDHEPTQALNGGPGGMDVVRRILRESPAFLSTGGWLLMELDPRQVDEALETAGAAEAYDRMEAIRDNSRRFRAISARVKPAGEGSHA